MQKINYVLTPMNLVAFVNGQSIEINKKSILFGQALTALQNANQAMNEGNATLQKTYADQLMSMRSVGDFLLKAISAFSIVNSQLFYNNADVSLRVGDVVTTRIIDALSKGDFDVQAHLKFIENILLNPNPEIAYELYQFLETHNLALTDDGCFFAFKNIRGDWKDIYSNSFDHSIGAIVRMEREKCDSVRTNTCSHGLHFCSKSYLSHYSHADNGKTIIVKVNPKDVVAIPVDYGFAKGRACEYTVIDEIESETLVGVEKYEAAQGVFNFTQTQLDDLDNKVCELIADLLGITGDIKPNDSLMIDLQADELDLIELIMMLEDEFGIEIPDELTPAIKMTLDANEESSANLEQLTVGILSQIVRRIISGNDNQVNDYVAPETLTDNTVVEWTTHGDKGTTSVKKGKVIAELGKFESAKAKLASLGFSQYSVKIEKDSSSIERVLVLVTHSDGIATKPIIYAPRASIV